MCLSSSLSKHASTLKVVSERKFDIVRALGDQKLKITSIPTQQN